MINKGLFEGIENKRNQCLIFLVFDTSGSMYGEKIGSVNRAIEDALDEMQKLSDSNSYSQIEVAVLDFSDQAKWVADSPKTPCEFKKVWNPLKASGQTKLGLALKELNSKLKRKSHGGWIDDSRGVCPPGIIFLTDGAPGDNWESGLALLKNNDWYNNAFKFCLIASDDGNSSERVVNVCKQLVNSGDGENGVHLISESNMRKLSDYIKLTTIAISKITSTVTNNSAHGKTEMQKGVDQRMLSIKQDLEKIDTIDDLIGD